MSRLANACCLCLLCVLASVASLAFGTSSALADTCEFADAGSGSWHDDANWSCGSVPTATDDAVVGTGDNAAVAADAATGGLSLDDTATLTLTNDSTLSVSGAMNVSAGTITWVQGGGLPGRVTVESTGSFVKTGSETLTINHAGLVLNGDGTLVDGSICLQATGAPLLEINAIFTIGGGDGFPCPNSSNNVSLVVNPGGQLIHGAAEPTLVNTIHENDGQINVQAGTLIFRQSTGIGTSSGTYTTQAGATTQFGTWGFGGSVAMRVGSGGSITGQGVTDLRDDLTLEAGATLTPGTLAHSGGELDTATPLTPFTPTTYQLDGGTLSGSMAATNTNVTTGTVTGGPANLIAPVGGTFVKTTDGQLTFLNGATLVLDVDGALQGGSIALERFSPSKAQINETLTMSGSGDFSGFQAGDPAIPQVFVNGPDGRLVKSDAGPVDIRHRTVVSGRVEVAAGQSLNPLSGIELTDGGVLAGGGQVGGNVLNTSGIVQPGSSPGTLTVNGSYTQGAAGTLQTEIEGTTPGTQFDVLDVNGAATLGGTLKVAQGGGFQPQIGNGFGVLESTSRSGTFAALDAPALPGGRSYKLSYPGGPSFGARLNVTGPSSGPPPGGDDDPPETTIDKGPKKKLKAKKRKAKATWEFSSDEAGASFECALDGEPFAPCSSPLTEKVKKGKHEFAVRARDAAGNLDATPAEHGFKVKRKKRAR